MEYALSGFSKIKNEIIELVKRFKESPIKINFVIENFSQRSWSDIEEVTPDEWDLKMLKDIDENPDCHEFVSQDELLKELNLTP